MRTPASWHSFIAQSVNPQRSRSCHRAQPVSHVPLHHLRWSSLCGAACGVVWCAVMCCAVGHQAVGNTEGSGKLDKMLSFWRDKGVFDAATIGRLQHEMHSGSGSALLLSNYPPPPAAAAAPPPGQPSTWGPAGTPTQPPQGPVSGGWGAPSPHMPAAAQPGGGGWGPSPTAFQPPPPYPQQQQQQPAWGAPPAVATPWGSGAAPPPAVPPPYPGTAVQPPQYQYGPGAVPPPGFPPQGGPVPHGVVPQHPGMGAVPPAGMGVGVPPGVGVLPGAAAEPPPGPQPVSSLAFPPGLLPQLCREKSKYAEAYASIEPSEIDKAGLPPLSFLPTPVVRQVWGQRVLQGVGSALADPDTRMPHVVVGVWDRCRHAQLRHT